MGHLGIRANLPALSDFVAAYIAGLHGRVLMMESTEMAHGASKEVDGGDNLVSECGFHFCYSGHVQAHDSSCVCRGSTGVEVVVQVLYPVGRCMVIGEVQAVRVRGGMVFEMREDVPRDGYSGSISSCGRGRSTERKSSQSQWKELSHHRELIFERKIPELRQALE